MAESNKRRKSKPKYFLWVALILLIVVFGGKSMYGEKEKTKTTDSINSNKNKKEIPYPYRVIPALDSSQHLIAYELHKNDSEDADYGAICSKYPKYSAIIKSVNPGKDDYKTNCRSVISDIVKTTGNATLEINIYDDYPSYALNEEEGTLQSMSLSKEASDSMLKHIVATYSGYIYGEYETYGENYILEYYPQTSNRYREKEKYEPKAYYNSSSQDKLNNKPRRKLFNQK